MLGDVVVGGGEVFFPCCGLCEILRDAGFDFGGFASEGEEENLHAVVDVGEHHAPMGCWGY